MMEQNNTHARRNTNRRFDDIDSSQKRLRRHNNWPCMYDRHYASSYIFELHHITDVTPRNSSNSPYKDYNIWLLMNETWPLKGLPTLHSTCSTTPKQHLPLQPWEELAADILCLTWIIDFTFFALKISIFRLFLHHFLPFGKFHQNHISRSVKRQRRQQHLSTF